MKKSLWTIACVLVPLSAFAQSAPSSYTVKFYNPGASQPVQQESFPATVVQCGQAKVAVTSTVNPTRFVWNDPADSTKDCIAPEVANGQLFSLPVGSYEGTLTAVNSIGGSAESNRAPFSVDAIPAVRTNFRVAR